MNRMNSSLAGVDKTSDPTAATSPVSVVSSFFAGALFAAILVLAWYLLALAHIVPGPSLKLLGEIALPLLDDLASFVLHSLSQNLPHVLLAGLLVSWFEAAFRRCVAEGRSPAQLAGLFKTLALLAGILSLAISLPGTLERALPSGAAKTAIGFIYFKLALWIIASMYIVIRQIRFLGTASPRAQ